MLSVAADCLMPIPTVSSSLIMQAICTTKSDSDFDGRDRVRARIWPSTSRTTKAKEGKRANRVPKARKVLMTWFCTERTKNAMVFRERTPGVIAVTSNWSNKYVVYALRTSNDTVTIDFGNGTSPCNGYDMSILSQAKVPDWRLDYDRGEQKGREAHCKEEPFGIVDFLRRIE